MTEYTSLTEKQKLHALSNRFYQNEKNTWEPKKGDYYTSSRADLELYQIVDVTDTHIITRYTNVEAPNAVWIKESFLTSGFGINRVHVPDWIFNIK